VPSPPHTVRCHHCSHRCHHCACGCSHCSRQRTLITACDVVPRRRPRPLMGGHALATPSAGAMDVRRRLWRYRSPPRPPNHHPLDTYDHPVPPPHKQRRAPANRSHTVPQKNTHTQCPSVAHARSLPCTCAAQAAVLVGGLIAGALRGDQLYVASILVAVPAAVVCIQLLGSLEVGQPQTPRRSEPSPTELGSGAETTELGSGAQTTGGCASPPTEPARGAETKEAQHDGGLASPATRAVDTPFTSDVAPAAAPAATAPAGSAHGGGLVRVLGMRYFWAVAFAPFVQGAAIGATFQIYAPMLLKVPPAHATSPQPHALRAHTSGDGRRLDCARRVIGTCNG
jgi:hypothetical protein